MLKVAWSPVYNHPVPEGHRFPMLKYDLIAEQLVYEGVISKDDFFEPEALDEETILLTHAKEYWSKLKELTLGPLEVRRIGFQLTPELVHREVVIMGGTVQASNYALEYGIGTNIAGGTHHAYADKGEGFCLLNDNAIAANYLLKNKLANRILIIDLDVHQGNGTAKIFEQQTNVFTFSMHGLNNIFSNKEYSDLDIELPNGVSDEEYLSQLEINLNVVWEQFNPDFVFYQSGVDVLETDKLGKLSLSKWACKERDRIVIKRCHSKKVPLVIDMGGGYSSRIGDIVDAHCNTFKVVKEYYV